MGRHRLRAAGRREGEGRVMGNRQSAILKEGGLVKLALLTIFLLLLSIEFGHADNITDIENGRFRRTITESDSQAVEAARFYYRNVRLKTEFEKLVRTHQVGVENFIRQKNPNIAPKEIEEFVKDVFVVFSEKYDEYLENWSILNLMSIFSKEELFALREFYRTDVGRSILEKENKVMSNFVRVLVPTVNGRLLFGAIQEVQGRLKLLGKDIKI
jgi:hypothetical protein